MAWRMTVPVVPSPLPDVAPPKVAIVKEKEGEDEVREGDSGSLDSCDQVGNIRGRLSGFDVKIDADKAG